MLNCVLIVDDDSVSNYIAEKVINSHGGVKMVTAVTNGKQAIDYLKHQCFGDEIYACPDLILLDLNMPYVDGFEFLKFKDRLPLEVNIPIVVLTSIEPTDVQKEEMIEKNISYMVKPLTNEKFKRVLVDLFQIT